MRPTLLAFLALALLLPGASALVPATLPGPERVAAGTFTIEEGGPCYPPDASDGRAVMVYDSSPSGAVWTIDLQSYGVWEPGTPACTLPPGIPLPVVGGRIRANFDVDVSRTGGVVTYPSGICHTRTWTVSPFPEPGPMVVALVIRDCNGQPVLSWTWDLTVV